jgi:hypothetical protein
MVQMTLFLLLSSTTFALASFGPNVRIDHEYRPDHSCINCAITVGPGAPSNQPIYVAFQDDSTVEISHVHSDVMFQKSTDAGRTWLPTAVLVRDGDPHAEDPDITTDSDGNVYIVWEDWYVDTAGGHYHRILCSRSSDGGTTWTAPARVDDRPDPTKWGIGGQRIAADSAGNLLCAWYDERMGSEGHIWSSVSTDRGATWSQNVRVCDDTTDYGCCPEDVFVQPGTNHYLVAAKVYRTPSSVSTDRGARWSRNIQVDDDTTDYDAGHPDVFVQPGTNRHLVTTGVPRWMNGRIIGCAYLYRSTDMGLTFQPGVQLDTFDSYSAHPHVVADREHIICDYFGDGWRVISDTIIAEARTFYTQGDSWGSPAPITNLDSVHEFYYSGPLALSGDGRVHTALSVQDTFDWDDNIYYTSSSDHGVSWSGLELVSDDTTVECWYPDIGADSAGHAYIVWYQPNWTRGEIWFATNAPAAIAEETPNAELRAPNSNPSVVRGVLFLAERPSSSASTSSLFDTSGREVLDLSPGANDVRALAPGVYFVRGPETEDGRPAGIRKVVVAR